MFEAYTERARRVIFFARYESSQFGSETIESEHLLLGLIREEKNLVRRFLSGPSPLERIRQRIKEQVKVREKISTSIDLPLSIECKRILAYAGEERERLVSRHIGTEQLFLGILRESGCLAARVLAELGVKVDEVRNQLVKEPPEQELRVLS
jgi:ATP-dependent Clp protease ATP-binding subunit ClpC